MGRLNSANGGHRRQAVLGFLAALISIGVVLGSLLLALTEAGTGLALNNKATITIQQTPIPVLTSKPTRTPDGRQQLNPTSTPTATASSALEGVACPKPSGWVVITVQADDTLEYLAKVYLVDVKILKEANCLVTNRLVPGVLLYVPAKPTEVATETLPPTKTAIPCGPPVNWYPYRIRPGDTLYSLAIATNSTVRELQRANCLSSPDRIQVGQLIYLPKPLPVFTPTVATSTATPATPPSTSADVQIALAAVPNPVNPGANLDFTLTIRNNGPDNSVGLNVKDTLPAGTSFVSAGGSGWSCSPSGGVVTCTLASLNSGNSSTINLRVGVASSATGTLTNQAVVTSTTSDPNPANNTASQNISVTSQADLALSMNVSTTTTTIGATVNYSIMIINNGPSAASSLYLTDNVDVNGIGVTGISASGTGWTCTVGVVVNCTLPSLSSGASSTVNVSVQASAAGTLTNQANISSAVSDPNNGNNTDSRNTTFTAQADLAVGITGPAGPVNINDPLSYTITVTNNGPNPATSLQLFDVVDVNGINVANVTAAGSGWSCSVGGTISCTLSNLAAGASSTITIGVQPTGSGILRNSASVSSSVTDPNLANNNAVKDITVN